MSYYPTERRGGCMESISRCCRQAYVYPLDTRKLLYAGGALVGVILVTVIWTGFSSSDDTVNPPLPQGQTVLLDTPLIVGCNFFPSNLRDKIHNRVSKIKFDTNLKNDTVFGIGNCSSCETDIPRLKSGLVGSQMWSIRVPCDAMYKDAVSITLEQVDAVTRLINAYPDSLSLVLNSIDIPGYFKSKQIGSVLSLSSGHSLDGRLPVLRTLYNLGVRVMALTSSCSNAWATSYTEKNDTGLTDLGKAMVKEMNRLGIVIDLSEASHKTQLDVLNVTKAPVIFSHDAAYNLSQADRNVKDDVLEKLKANKGIVMVTFAQKYLNASNPKDINANTSIKCVFDHINFIRNTVGVEGVGIGGEFDAEGENYPALLSDVSSFPELFNYLGKEWTNHEDLKKLAGENMLRVFQEVEKVAKGLTNLEADETYSLPTNSSCYSDFESRKVASESTPTAATSEVTSVPTTVQTQPTSPPTKSSSDNTITTQVPANSTEVTTNSTQVTTPAAKPGSTV